jgi:hypothetical protein
MESISREEVLFTPTHGSVWNDAWGAFSRLGREVFLHRSDVLTVGDLNGK